YSDEWKAYDGLVNMGYKRHYRVKHSDNVFANGKAHINGIESFWGVARHKLSIRLNSRLKQGSLSLGGLRKDKFYLHLKETEWRFNHRKESLYSILLREFRKKPL
ncbi:MAG: transposase, partial [Helicobacteraceae bacterium]|nr:transposase [Helicobacteraceae bacterium]